MEELNDMWQKVMSKLEVSISTVSIELWIKPLEVLSFENKEDKVILYLGAPSNMIKKQVCKNHLQQIEECASFVFNQDVEAIILDPLEKEDYVKKQPQKSIQEIQSNMGFNPKYIFDNFVVGKENNATYAACQSVAEYPGESFNPLFIYGGVGLGKTHLLHAIGNYILAKDPNKKVKYVTCEQFTNDYIQAILDKKDKLGMFNFREKYRCLDVLLIDDIHFITNKDSTQEEFFHTFNDLYQNNKQIVISSDRPPKEIQTLTERLQSRFQSGLIQDIQPPEFETRVAIINAKIKMQRWFYEQDVIDYIAQNFSTDIRKMESFLTTVHFMASLNGRSTAIMEDVYRALKEKEKMPKENITMDTITKIVCDHYKIPMNEIVGKKKTKDVVEPRMVAIYLIYEILGAPLWNIGEYFGGRDHTTVGHARDKITEMVKNNHPIADVIKDLERTIKVS